MKTDSTVNRCEFISGGGGVLAATAITSACASSPAQNAKRLKMAIVGTGSHGRIAHRFARLLR
jgi:hypothetical protein